MTSKLTMRQIEAFLSVMTVGTVTGAASLLNTSQPAVTRSLKQLEDATKLTLFNRHKMRLEPTPDAYALLPEVRASFSGLDRIAEAAANIHQRRMGHLRFACLPALAQGFIARVVASFIKLHPQASISIEPLLSGSLISSLKNQDIDFGVAAYEIEEAGIEAKPFTLCDEVLVLPAGHRLREKEIVRVGDLVDERIIRLSAEDPYRQRLERLLRDNHIVATSIVETSTSSGLCALVEAGVGVGVVNPLSALDFAGPKFALRRFEPSLPFVTTLVRSPAMGKSKLLNDFISLIIRQRDEDLAKVQSLLDSPETMICPLNLLD